MQQVTIEVSSLEQTKARFVAAMTSGNAAGNFITFPTVESLWDALSPNRWRIVQTMTGAGSMSMRELARRVQRDVKSVHGDVHALLAAGVIERADDGGIVFPYDRVKVKFELAPLLEAA